MLPAGLMETSKRCGIVLDEGEEKVSEDRHGCPEKNYFARGPVRDAPLRSERPRSGYWVGNCKRDRCPGSRLLVSKVASDAEPGWRYRNRLKGERWDYSQKHERYCSTR